MPVNPVAYMSGAIPSLSRGGSWQNLPGAQPSPLDSASFASPDPGGSIYPRASQIAPPSPGSGMGNRTNIHFGRHPWAMNPALPQSPLSHQYASSYAPSQIPPSTSGRSQYHTAREGSISAGSQGGSMMSGRAPVVGPTRHPGWTGMPPGGYSTPSSPTIYAASITPPRSASRAPQSPSIPASPRAYYSSFSPHAGPRSPQQEWEWASGSPKPMTSEPDYFSPRHAHSERQYTPTAMSLRLPEPKKRNTTSSPMPQPLPPPPQSGRLRLDSQSRLRAHPQRPAPPRRHTDRYSPSTDIGEHETMGSRSNSKSLGKRRACPESPYIPLEVQKLSPGSYYASSKGGSAPRSHDAPDSLVGSQARSQSARPPTVRQHSGLVPSPPSYADTKAMSLTERRLKQGCNPRPSLPTIIYAGSTIDFTSRLSATARTVKRDPFNLADIRDSLPPMPATASPAGHTPSEDEDYDRYTAHPAVPSERADHEPQAKSRRPALGMDLKNIPAAEYRPPCFPPVPSKKLKWNREGPAMKTHGVAWLRDTPDGPLPTGPQGPRWAQARPPNLDLPQDGNWWESGVG
jgi:hypothetical protein